MRTFRIGILLLAAGCTTAQSRAVERAIAAEARGDTLAAAEAWAEACRHEAADCPRAVETRERALAEVALGAAPACTSGDTARCVEALRAGRAFAPDDLRLIDLAEEAGRLQLARCDAEEENGFSALRCAEGWRDRLATAGYDRALQERRSRLAAGLVSSLTGDVGADAARLGAAACLEGTADRRAAAEEAVRRLDRQLALPLRIDWRFDASEEIECTELVGRRTIRCDPAGARLVFEGAVHEPRHERRAEVERVEWVATTTEVPNPAWAAASTRLLVAEEALRAAEVELGLAEDDCRAAEAHWRAASACFDCPARRERDHLCERARKLSSLKTDRRFEVMDARTRLDSTPAMLKREIRKTGGLEKIDHTWSFPWKVRVSLGSEVLERQGVAVHRDREHPALVQAGIAADPLVPPPPGFAAGQAAFAARQLALTLLDRTLAARVEERGRDCPDPARTDDASLACRAEVRRFSGQSVDGGELLAALAGGPIRCR